MMGWCRAANIAVDFRSSDLPPKALGNPHFGGYGCGPKTIRFFAQLKVPSGGQARDATSPNAISGIYIAAGRNTSKNFTVGNRKVRNVRLRGEPVEIEAHQLPGVILKVQPDEVDAGQPIDVGKLKNPRGAIRADIHWRCLRELLGKVESAA